MIIVDGSEGEGGGQVLRTSLCLSMVTGQAVRVENIRARRSRPGLMRQHLASVHAAVAVSGATVRGDELGSTTLEFTPGPVRAGNHRFTVGTAGSTSLVLQTVVPALLRTAGTSTLEFEGGTHNPLAPPFDALSRAWLPLVLRTGARVELELLAHGFYPAGGGHVRCTVRGVEQLSPFTLEERGAIRARAVSALVSRLPRHVGPRELEVFAAAAGWNDADARVLGVRTDGPGNALVADIASEHVHVVLTSFGEKGVRAETVAEDLATQVLAYERSGAALDEHLADQAMLVLALAGGGAFRASALAGHARTQADLVPRFLPVRFKLDERHGAARVEISPAPQL